MGLDARLDEEAGARPARAARRVRGEARRESGEGGGEAGAARAWEASASLMARRALTATIADSSLTAIVRVLYGGSCSAIFSACPGLSRSSCGVHCASLALIAALSASSSPCTKPLSIPMSSCASSSAMSA